MKKIIVFGSNGLVGSKFLQISSKMFSVSAPSSYELDILDKDKVLEFLREKDAGVVINFAAYTDVEEAEKQKGSKESLSYQINAVGAKNVADAAKILAKHLIHISTEYVFDGEKNDSPYTEEDNPNPINWYGQTKYFGEQFVLGSGCLYTIVRISMPYSSYYKNKTDIARFFLTQLNQGNQIKAVKDQNITPTLTDDIAKALIVLVKKKQQGIYHVSSKNYTTPFDFAKLIARTFNLNSTLIIPILLDEYNHQKQARLLKNSWLNPSKFVAQFGEESLRSIQEDLELFKQDVDEADNN